MYQLKVSRCSILNEYFADQFEKYLGATEVSRQKTPGNEQQLDLRIEREESEMVEKWLHDVEYRHDHPEHQPGKVVLCLVGGDGHQREVSRKDEYQRYS